MIQKTKINMNRTDIWETEIKYHDQTSSRMETIVITEQHELENYDDAITYNNAIKWKVAMDDEIDSLRKSTWTLVNALSNHQVIDNQWT